MNAHLLKPNSSLLSNYIEYFLFLKNDEKEGVYRTFPNTNVCLALYKDSSVFWDRDVNTCTIKSLNSQIGSRLIGFHKRPFTAIYEGDVDQVCVLFKMGGLNYFSKIPLNEIDMNSHPFEQLFGREHLHFLDIIFSVSNTMDRAFLIEDFLLKRLISPHSKTIRFIQGMKSFFNSVESPDRLVWNLAKKNHVDESTLYRRFLSIYGLSPQLVLQTIRFRMTLNEMVLKGKSFSEIDISDSFFDQSHFIKSIRKFTGETPRKLIKKTSVVDGTFLWMKE